MPYSARLASAVALFAIAVAGCTTDTPGTARPSGSGANDISTNPSQSSTNEALPPRPREIKINGVDLCALWTPEQLRQLSMPQEPASRTDDQGKPWCFFNNEGNPDLTYGLKARLDKDVTDWLGPGQVEQTSVGVIAGFPAVQLHGRTTSSGCAQFVSTARGQYLQVETASSDADQFTIEQMCELAKKAATFATQTLQTLR